MQLSTLVVAEHKNSRVANATFNTISAALALGEGKLSVLLAGNEVQAVGKELQTVPGVHQILIAEQQGLEHQLAEPFAELIAALHRRQASHLGFDCALELV